MSHITLLTLLMFLIQPCFAQDWRVDQARAKYRAATSVDELAQLEREFAAMVHFDGDRAPESVIEAGRTLAAYRRNAVESSSLSSWAESTIELFLLNPHGPHNAPARYLGVSGRLIQPGTVFRDGAVLAFSRSFVWFETLSGEVRILPTGLPAREPVTDVYLSVNAPSESNVGAVIADLTGKNFSYIGDPKPLITEHRSRDLAALLDDLLADKYKVYASDDAVSVFDSRDAEQNFKKMMPDAGPSQPPFGDGLIDKIFGERTPEEFGNSVMQLVEDSFAWTGQHLSDHPDEAYELAERIVNQSFNAYPTTRATDEELETFLTNVLWFDKDREHPKLWRNMLDGFRQASQGDGRYGQRAARFVEMLEKNLDQ